MHINPETLKLKMQERGFATFTALADKAGVSTKSLARIKEGRASNRTTVKRLAQALDVTPDALCEAPDAEARRKASRTLEELGYKTFPVRLDRPTRLALRLVLDRYDVTIQTLIKLLPLFAVIMFEKALAERRARLAAFEAAHDAALALAPPHLEGARCSIDDALMDEHNSIAARDVCGAITGNDACNPDAFNPEGLNLFGTFLRGFTADIDDDLVEIDGAWFPTLDSLRFRVLYGPLDALTNGDPRALFALENDHVLLRDMPAALRGDDQREARAAWLAGHVTDAAWAAEQKRVEDLLADIEL